MDQTVTLYTSTWTLQSYNDTFSLFSELLLTKHTKINQESYLQINKQSKPLFAALKSSM